MRISILLPDLRGGGAERVNLDLAKEFARQGHEVEFVLRQARGELLEEAQAAFPVVSLGTPRVRQVPLALARYLRHRRPAVLLASMWPLTGMAIISSFLAGASTRVIVSDHFDFRVPRTFKTAGGKVQKLILPLLYRHAHGIVAVSQGVADSMAEVCSLPRESISVIPNPLRMMSPEALTAEEHDALSGWLAAPIRIIAVGSLKRQKRYDVLIRAISMVRESHDARLLVLGEGALRKNLEALVAELSLEEAVFLPGFKPNTATFLQHASLFVLSSDWEGFGNVVVEALAMGTPVVSTDCPSGPAEILENGRFGTLVPPRSPEALAEAILAALSSPVDTGRLKARAEHFSAARAANAYLSLMRHG